MGGGGSGVGNLADDGSGVVRGLISGGGDIVLTEDFGTFGLTFPPPGVGGSGHYPAASGVVGGTTSGVVGVGASTGAGFAYPTLPTGLSTDSGGGGGGGGSGVGGGAFPTATLACLHETSFLYHEAAVPLDASAAAVAAAKDAAAVSFFNAASSASTPLPRHGIFQRHLLQQQQQQQPQQQQQQQRSSPLIVRHQNVRSEALSGAVATMARRKGVGARIVLPAGSIGGGDGGGGGGGNNLGLGLNLRQQEYLFQSSQALSASTPDVVGEGE